MTRRELRENVFKMLFRVEFFDAGELSEQTLGIWSDSSCTRHRRRTDCIGKL